MSAPPPDTRRVGSQAPFAALLPVLREGGAVLVMRHAHCPRERPVQAEPDNPARERQLDAAGQRDAAAMGEALRQLGIPLGLVMASPAYRTRQTARLVSGTEPRIIPELAAADEVPRGLKDSGALWLRQAAANPPAPQTNTLIVTHAPNMLALASLTDLAPAETLVLRPEGAGTRLLCRLRIEHWPPGAGPRG